MDKISSPTSQTPKRFQTGSPTVPSPSFRTTATTSDTSASGTGGGANRPAPASMGTSTTVPTTSKATSGATKVPQTQGVKVSPNAASSPEESLYTCTGSNSNNNSIRVVTSENVWLEAKDEVDYVPESIRNWSRFAAIATVGGRKKKRYR
eukprot:Tbor_TRINITY_DN5313_c0_g6::TRINITY_DN5313_c0_g6_i2::g.4542::m.4542